LERQDKKLPALSRSLIKNPATVELILSQMTFDELLEAERRGLKLKPAALRQQFANMVTRCMQNMFEKCDFPAC